MVNFIIPLKSRAIAADWEVATSLCCRTIGSVLQQSDPNFRVFLVCTDRPQLDLSHPALTVIEEPFPVPEPTHEARGLDKANKIRRGLLAAKDHGDGHVMILDADDLIHRELVATVQAEKTTTSWVVSSGFIYYEGEFVIYLYGGFDRFCGSSLIVFIRQEEFPADMNSSRDSYFDFTRKGHMGAAELLEELGRPIKDFPFPGVVYVKGTGENDSGSPSRRFHYRGWRAHLRQLRAARPVTRKLRGQFGLTPVNARRQKTALVESK